MHGYRLHTESLENMQVKQAKTQPHRRAGGRPFRPLFSPKAAGVRVLDLVRVKSFAKRVAMVRGGGEGGVGVRQQHERQARCNSSARHDSEYRSLS